MMFRIMDWLFAHPRVLGWGMVAFVIFGAILEAKDIWLLFLGIGLFLWGLSMRRRAVRRAHGYL
jgi:hypothetical protein